MTRATVPRLPDTPIPKGLGIYKNRRNTRYLVTLRLNGGHIDLGSYTKLEDAITASMEARQDIIDKRTIRRSRTVPKPKPLPELKGTPFYGL